MWCAHFLLVYASESLLCTRGGGAAHLAVIALATAAGLAVVGTATAQNWRQASTSPASAPAGAVLMHGAGAVLGLMSMLGVLWSALHAVMVASCTPAE